MAKIDCSVTVNYLRELKRICDGHRYSCGDCPLKEASRHAKCTCSDYAYAYPESVVEIVQEWSDEHPVKTRLDDLLEKYPNVEMDNGAPVFYPLRLGYCKDCSKCIAKADRKECWYEPLDGGATGKAVE